MSETKPEATAGKSTVVAVYNSHEEAEAAVQALQKSGCDMKRLSIVGKDFHTEEHVVGYYNLGDRMCAWSKVGAFWGSIWGLLLGSAFFIIPGIGPVLIGGTLATTLVGALEGAAVGAGLSALGAALFSLGIPQNSVLAYETDVKAGKYVLIFQGAHTETLATKTVLELTDHEGIQEHKA